MIHRIALIICIVASILPMQLFAQTAAPADITNALNQFVEPTGIEQQSLTEAAGGGIEVAYQVTGLIFFILALYAGILWMTAQGKEDTIAKARNILIGATIGLVVIVSAYGITSFVTSRALPNFSTDGSTTLPDGAGDPEDGTFDVSPVGCCIYRNSRRTSLSFMSDMVTFDDCERQVNASGADTDFGDGSNDDHDWSFYDNITDVEQCVALNTCWNFANNTRKIECIAEVTSR